jgi:hypothetical protein
MNESSTSTEAKAISRRTILLAGALGGASTLLAGCGIGADAAAAGGKRSASLYLTIATPAMLGTDDMPAYLPAYPHVPANATVHVEIMNFDDATALTGGLVQFAKVKGTVGGTVRVEALNLKDPNAAATAQVLSELDPQNVSHTFTIAKLGVNVPVSPKARTSFVIQTGAPGVFPWRCNDPCGTGASGWGGAMAADRFMMGKLTVE